MLDKKTPFKNVDIFEIKNFFPEVLVSLHTQLLERGLDKNSLHPKHKQIFENLWSLNKVALPSNVGDFYCLKEEFLKRWAEKKTFSWEYVKPKVIIELYLNKSGNLQVLWYPKTNKHIWQYSDDDECDFRFFNTDIPIYERPNNELLWVRDVQNLVDGIYFNKYHGMKEVDYDYKSLNILLISVLRSKYYESFNILSRFYDVEMKNDMEVDGYTLNFYDVAERKKYLKEQEEKRRKKEFKEKLKESLEVFNISDAKKFLNKKKPKKEQFDIWLKNETRTTLIPFMEKYKKENY